MRAQHALHGQQYSIDDSPSVALSHNASHLNGKGVRIWDALKSPVLRYQLHVGESDNNDRMPAHCIQSEVLPRQHCWAQLKTAGVACC